ncbi:MAG TPA: phospholipase D-like domain-containing protein [Trebonia sp.]|nr:phospholipase D-like domain-containing protein [Trebonia sp.]
MFHRRLFQPTLAAAAVLAASAALGLTAGASQAAARPQAVSPSGFTLHTEPDAGFSWLYKQIGAASSSIDMTMYELSDTTAEDDLAAAQARGVRVRVILDGRQERTNEAAYDYLTEHGVGVVWSWDQYYFTHEKSIVLDGSTADVMTLNLTSQYYSTSRDFAVVDTSPGDVSAIAKVFDADYAHDSVTPGGGDDLTWSPTTSQADLLGLVNGAQHSLQVFSEEMDDSAVVDALCQASDGGVDVQVVGENEDGHYDRQYDQLANCGVHISTYSSTTGFYIHGKAILADYAEPSARIFIGSQNFSRTSLTENRELGLIINDPAIESSVNATFESDFAGGTAWS